MRPTLPLPIKLRDALLLSIFFILIVMPAVEMRLRLLQVENTEKRAIARFEWSSIINYHDFRDYFNYNFGFRDLLIRWNSVIKHKLFSVPAVPQVILGRNGWLYYYSEKANDGISMNDYMGLALYTNDELSEIRRNVEEQRDWLKDRGIAYMIVVCPNKQSIYPEYLPDAIKEMHGKTRLDQAMEYLTEHSDFQMIDVRDKLLEAKLEYDVYYKTDTHWNSYGGFIAYKEIVKHLSTYFSGIAPAEISRYKIIREPNNGEGDLALMLAINGYVEDENIKLESRDPQLLPKRRVPCAIIYHDSFAVALAPHFVQSFERVVVRPHKRRLGCIDPKLIEEERPDVVILELVERYMDLLLVGDARFLDRRIHTAN